MKMLQISSVPLLTLLQKACEVLVVDNLINLPHTFNCTDRRVLLDENLKANELIDHIIELIKENQSDSSNPKS